MSRDLLDELQSALGTTYIIERELGGGGMSRVFLAEETRLGRKVVVKVLSTELAAEVSADRFEREIRVAAMLAHPSIVPVLTAGDANGLPYYTMPFVHGESLRAHLANSERIPLAEAASILRDIARALAYAHERGIIHRDIKPENVLLASGAAVVTDFGIAKAISASRTDSGEPTLTRAGTAVGTPAYMSPEQVTADPSVDARADLYAFGCVAYEMIAGHPPFHSRPVPKLLAAHVSEDPIDVASIRPDCPRALAAFVMQCLEKEPSRRPKSALDVLPALETVTTPAGTRTDIDRPSAHWMKRGIPRALAALGILAVVAVVTISLLKSGREAPTNGTASTLQSVAVLPFANAEGDTANAYFADGIAEELATSLSKVPGLRVVARHSSFQNSGRQVDAREAGKVLNVDALLSGSVRRAGANMRVTARLVAVKDESLLWSDQYNREVKDVFSMQDEITRSIVGAIRGHLASSGKTSIGPILIAKTSRGTPSLDAHDLYLRAQFNLRRRAVPAAVTFFERAINLDPDYARAHSGLSAALEMTPYYAGIPADSVRTRAMNAAGRALSLDSSLAEPHTSLALAYQHAHQWSDAEREHRRAVELDPGDAAAHMQLARLLLSTGRANEALDEFRRAEEIDPFSPVIASWIAYVNLRFGNTSEALTAAKRGVELDSTTAPAVHVAALAHQAIGQNEAAIRMIDRLPNVLPWTGFRANLHAVAGNRSIAERIAREIESRPRAWAAQTALAWTYLGLGDTTRALDALERATDLHETWFVWYTVADPLYDPVRKNPRFVALLRRVGLNQNMFSRK
ncbi:MAG TPA: protein kinase [Gemmatimonadaceae bacterium]